MKKNNPNLKTNRNILRFAYIVVGLFICVIAYMAYFVQVRSESVINNTYNARLNLFSDRMVRGSIMSSDGQVLAQTVVGEDGEEKREYPFGSLFAHAVGYSDNGKTGLEALANFYLLSSHVNLVEQVTNQLADVKNPGDSIVTTLDTSLQKAASDLLGDRKGAVVVMEPNTGKILAMISKPGFDPNRLSEDWDSLVADEGGEARLLNRASQGLYPPGSTFKIVTAMEYLREHPDDYQSFTFDCAGVYQNGEYTIKCYHSNVHGHQNLKSAFANSCNGAFAKLGLSLDKKRLKGLSEELLFNQELPLSIAYSKSSYEMNEEADTWETLQTSIGQGKTQITPMHNAMIVSSVANGGMLMKPYMIDRVENAAGETVKKFMPGSYGTLMSAEEAEMLTDFMRGVVNEGTASALRTDAYTAAGKTGSAEFDKNKETHAWFVGFAPAESPEIAVSILVEEGGSGGKAAAPIARGIFDTYFSVRGK
ncbi:penicillin-binding transpeptidase domain-containing protein [Clostridium sp. AM58-1XD]|uniref:peptidoglycan D,D-transpeptidase FtsI family protein n=1 Tax=Clostridium sp. AM58-1XD TaxID=2292307 RepID=UPI000E550DE7|nr:penicillin-binding transpeptidase domain-containing protein [Clostridium sp. AM58-1XD]RGY97806.1 penicillin-binding protein 2 [Clostridium sp. AM58-1XD]